MDFAKGKCIVTKQECTGLVLPKGSYSNSTNVVISQEGANGLKALLSDKDAVFKENAMCCINRQVYEKCLVVPRGVFNPKVPKLISADAINGIVAAIKEGPKEEPVEEPVKEEIVEEVTSESQESLKLDLEIAEDNIKEIEAQLLEAQDSEAAKLQNELVAAKAKRDAIVQSIEGN